MRQAQGAIAAEFVIEEIVGLVNKHARFVGIHLVGSLIGQALRGFFADAG